MDKSEQNRKDVAAYEQRQRDQGRVQRKRWAHPNDWVLIDQYIDLLTKIRQEKAQ